MGITISLIYIYGTFAQVVGNGFCSSVVEHWSSNPEDAVRFTAGRPWSCILRNLVPVGSYNVYLYTLEFHT